MTDSLNPEQTNMEQTDEETSAELNQQIRNRLAQQLRSARKQKGLTIEEASSQLKIRKAYIQALEDNDWKALPEEVYALGFLRQYAALLDADCHQDIEALRSSENYRLTKPYTIPDPSIAPSKTWAIAAAILFALLFILFNTVGDDENKTSPAKVSVADTHPVPPTVTTKEVIPEASVEKNAPPAPQLSTASSGAVHPSSKVTPVSPLQTKKAIPLITPVEKTVGTHSYRLTAIESSAWLQVYDSSGVLLKEALLHPGQSLLLESEAPFLTVTCGNAAALKIEVDHTLYAAAGTLGDPGKVLRGFRIDASVHDH